MQNVITTKLLKTISFTILFILNEQLCVIILCKIEKNELQNIPLILGWTLPILGILLQFCSFFANNNHEKRTLKAFSLKLC